MDFVFRRTAGSLPSKHKIPNQFCKRPVVRGKRRLPTGKGSGKMKPGIPSPSAPVTGARALHELFEARAAERPDAPAVVSAAGIVTYGELDARANRLAVHLKRRGIARGFRVALLAPRSADTYAAILGILKTGSAYVPLDPD